MSAVVFEGVATSMAITLSVVFGFAGLMKLRGSTTEEMERLRLPAPRVLASVVPIVELGTAGLLLVAPRWGAAAALVLLSAFTFILVRTIRSGRSVSCGCLGSLSTRPISWTSVARNGALAVMAMVTVSLPSLSRVDLASLLVFIGYGLLAVVATQLLALWQITGRLWSVQLAGEPAGRSISRRSS